MKWLVTCFEPFDRALTNSSQIIWKTIQSRDWRGEVEFLGPLPVIFDQSWLNLERELMRPGTGYDGVLALGQAEGRSKISLECVGLNYIDARIPDNSGALPPMGEIQPGAEIALWTDIPWAELEENELWSRSYSAGTYVCNYLLFRILQWSHTHGRRGGFIHIPLVESQTEAQFDGLFKLNDVRVADALTQILRFLCKLQPRSP